MTGSSTAATLWLPIEKPARAWAAVTALFAVYLLTMSRDMSLYDSPELALAAVQLGLGHPPGQPLHTMLGWLLSHLPGIPPLVGLNLLSVLPAALTVLPVISIGEGLLGRGSAACEQTPGRLLYLIIALCGLQAGLWEPATRIEVYALGTFFAAWAAARLAAALDGFEASGKGFLTIGLGLGLSASANPYCALAAAVAAVPGMAVLLIRRALPLRAIFFLGAGGVAGLLPYLYVFWAAHRQGVFVWGAPTDAASALHYFAGADFRGRTYQVSAWFAHAWQWLLWSTERAMLPLTLIGIAAHLLLGRGRGLGRGYALWVYLFVLWLVAANSFFRPDVPDHLGYMALPVWLSAAGSGALAATAARRTPRFLFYGFAAALALSALFAPPQLPARTRHLDRVTRMMAEGALDAAPPGAILVVASDHWASPLLYLQLGEHRRGDVVIMPYGLASSSWYWEQMFDRHPGLMRIQLRGPGGREGRIRRFLDANRDRPFQLEDWWLAAVLGLVACPGGWMLDGGRLCESGEAVVDPGPIRALAAQLALLGRGSPGTEGMIAAAAFGRGESLRRLGYFDAALQAYLAGVSVDLRPKDRLPRIGRLSGADARLSRGFPPPVWIKPVALGDPGRNLFMAGSLLTYAGKPRQGMRFIFAASNAGITVGEMKLLRPPRAR